MTFPQIRDKTLTQLFTDVDMSGSIEKAELMTLWRQMSVELDNEQLEAMFAEADVDQSGKVS